MGRVPKKTDHTRSKSSSRYTKLHMQALLRPERAIAIDRSVIMLFIKLSSTKTHWSGGKMLELWENAQHEERQLVNSSNGVRKAISGVVHSFGSAFKHNSRSISSCRRISDQDVSIDPKETQKFAKLAKDWWDPDGPFKPLHAMNRVRCDFIRNVIADVAQRHSMTKSSMKVLDVGCGGGILSESIARMGPHVLGIDVNEAGIKTAQEHALLDGTLRDKLKYETRNMHDVASESEKFDLVIASEVIEHVASTHDFCVNLVKATRPGGSIVLSTLNRTASSYMLAILGAEYIMRWVPQGTHDWGAFVTPEEMVTWMDKAGAQLGRQVIADGIAGMSYQPITGLWYLGRNIEVNYIASFCVE